MSGSEYTRFGGNTTCIAFESAGKLIIVDCGSGLLALQKELFDTRRYSSAEIYITHLHWDHIQGIAFFNPFFNKYNSFDIYSESRYGNGIGEQIKGIMNSPMFPVNADAFQANISYHDILCGQTCKSSIARVDTIRLEHPNICTGYRFEMEGKIVCVICDCEKTDEAAEKLIAGADVLIYDAQYTKEEYQLKKGWGHSTWEDGCRLAKKCRVKQLVLTHHDPFRSDQALEQMQEEARKDFKEAFFSYDGMQMIL